MAEESAEKGKRELIAGIETDAKQEAERIATQAEKEITESRESAEAQVRNILREAGERAKAQAEAASRRVLSGLEVEVRRKLLKGQHGVFNEVIEKVRERVRELAKGGGGMAASGGPAVRGGPAGYRAVLKNWIVEAMVGLGSDRAEVTASVLDMPYLDAALLSEAAEEVKRLTGRAVELVLAGPRTGESDPGDSRGGQSEPTRSLGVVLTDRERRIAFNNQLDTRIVRKQRAIQALIHDALFRDTTEERV